MADIIYLMKSETGLMKIGKAVNPMARQRTLSKSSGLKIDIVQTFNTMRSKKVMPAIRVLLKDHHRMNDWFNVSEQDALAAVEEAIAAATPTQRLTNAQRQARFRAKREAAPLHTIMRDRINRAPAISADDFREAWELLVMAISFEQAREMKAYLEGRLLDAPAEGDLAVVAVP